MVVCVDDDSSGHNPGSDHKNVRVPEGRVKIPRTRANIESSSGESSTRAHSFVKSKRQGEQLGRF